MKDTLQELKEFRRAGIRTFADAEVYEADKKRRSTVQPSLSTALPGSLPRNWQYGMASADSNLQVFAPQSVAASIASIENFPRRLGCFVSLGLFWVQYDHYTINTQGYQESHPSYILTRDPLIPIGSVCCSIIPLKLGCRRLVLICMSCICRLKVHQQHLSCRFVFHLLRTKLTGPLLHA